MAWIWTFKVSADNARFPLDMLRYDACYPRSSSDVEEMHLSLDTVERQQRRIDKKPFEVELISHNGNPQRERWLSFGWEVIHVKKERP